MLDVEESMLDVANEERAELRSARPPRRPGEECEHLEGYPVVETGGDGTCARCLGDGTRWVALRQCLECGHVGLLRLLARPARHRALPRERPPGHAVRRARRGLAVVLRAPPHA